VRSDRAAFAARELNQNPGTTDGSCISQPLWQAQSMSRIPSDAAQYEPIDENGDQPVTGAEFHEAMRGIGRSFARVELNVAGIRADMATKADLEVFATKDELRQLEERFDEKISTLATKDELSAMEDRLAQQIKASGENIVKALSQHIDTAVKAAVDRRFTQHELRLSRLEEQAGLSPAA
jgi:hypothetical protein